MPATGRNFSGILNLASQPDNSRGILNFVRRDQRIARNKGRIDHSADKAWPDKTVQ
jgi:hypothetical protein